MATTISTRYPSFAGVRPASSVTRSVPSRSLSSILLRLVETVEVWAERRRQRRALLELSEHMLRDIGISRLDALREAGKPFWLP